MRALLGIGPAGADGAVDVATQAARTADALRSLGVDAVVSSALAPDLSELDVVHLFGAEPAEPLFRLALRARGAGLSIVLTPALWCRPPEGEPSSREDRILALRDQAMRQVVFGLSSALTPSSRAELERISAHVAMLPARVVLVPVGADEVVADGDRDFTWERTAEATLAVYNAVMDERGASRESDWRATFTPDQYIEHLESLIQLQLEAIAVRDGHFAGVVEYAQSLEADRERREEYITTLERDGPRLRQAVAARLPRFRR